MIRLKVVGALCLIKTACMASSLSPFPTSLVDRAFAATKSAELGLLALGVLERVAEGRPVEIDPLAAGKIGLKPSEVQDSYLKSPSARAYAMRTIGEVDLPEALNYLSRLKREDFSSDDSGHLWPAAFIGLHTARLNRISDSQGKIEFLENGLEGGGFIARWAANELCDRGSQKSLPFIRASIKKRDSSQRGENEIRFCEVRTRVLTHDPDRLKALVSVLSVNDDQSGSRDLELWAVGQLVALHLLEADQALERYRGEIDKLPAKSSAKERLYPVGEAIYQLMVQRSRRGQ
jgi:hypothetical protein